MKLTPARALVAGALFTACSPQNSPSVEATASDALAAFALPAALDAAATSIAGIVTTPVADPARTLSAPTTATSALVQALPSFPGTGGPGGHFVYRVRPLPGGTTVFNTVFDTITDETGSLTANCVNGVIDVYDLVIEPGAVLQLRGPNPCVIRVLHDVDIQGTILLRGGIAADIMHLPINLFEAGGSGNAGGGAGGNGSPALSQSSARGESGYGPFGNPNAGGAGGESSVSTSSGRAGGGGGGAFAVDVPRRVSATALNPACPEQFIIGLDAENGSNGQAGITGALSGIAPPQGGLKGPRPFKNLNPADPVLAALDDDAGTPTQALFRIDDFWGVMSVGTNLVRGELLRPWAGAGGGGGGDVIASTTFPTTPFNPAADKRGAGGGGGGGALTIFCLGTIRFGAVGRIDASGGAGMGGQNTSGINRIAGGSGGGSGGHVILQAGGDIDFTACVPGSSNTNYVTGAGIFARGGQGGEGANAIGGTNLGGSEEPPHLDRLPPNHYPSATAPCGVTLAAQGGPNNVGNVDGAGGDGGPGVIQLHVTDLERIRVPLGLTKLSQLIQPHPVGSTPLNADVPASWHRLVPLW
jgi:hypothetical protein